MDSVARPRALRRRNGRLQACDPCRARKVACDHGQPVCGRCRKGNQDAKCAYTVAAAPIEASSYTQRIPQQHHESPRAGGFESIQDPALSRGSDLGADASFLGFTNPTTVYRETRQSLSLLRGPASGRTGGVGGGRAVAKDPRVKTLSPPLRESCLMVLMRLPGLPAAPIRAVGDITEPSSWEEYLVASVVDFLRSRYGARAPTEADLEQLAERVNRNTTRPLRDIHSSSKEWLDQFCGANLRWETLGLMWANLERLSDALTSLKAGFLQWKPGRRSKDLAMECMTSCLHLAQYFNQGNDLVVDLCRRICALQSIITGDASFGTWTYHGLSVSALTSRGLHLQEPSNSTYQPSLCSEYKRWLFACIFANDKTHSSFSGRPPLLSRRFCTTPMPLDLGPEELLGGDKLQDAVNALDQDGWSTRGRLHPATMLRLKLSSAFMIEEIVNIALSQSPCSTLGQLDELKLRQLESIKGVPEILKYDPKRLDDPGSDMVTFYASILIYLTHLQNAFFIERLRLSYGAADDGDLLITSFDLVSVTMALWTHKDRFLEMRRNFEWLLIAYAAPGGGILCLELLRPTVSGGGHPRDSRITRSKIVQQLSLLTAFLDWVQPSAPNSDLCLSCKEIIEHVLDHHLNAPAGDNWAIVAPAWDVANPYDFNFELLDTFDWIQGETAGELEGSMPASNFG